MVDIGVNEEFVEDFHNKSTNKVSAEKKLEAANTEPDRRAALYGVKAAHKAIQRHLNPTSHGFKLTVD